MKNKHNDSDFLEFIITKNNNISENISNIKKQLNNFEFYPQEESIHWDKDCGISEPNTPSAPWTSNPFAPRYPSAPVEKPVEKDLRDEIISNLQEAINRLNRIVADKDKAISDRDAKIAEQARALKEANRLIEEMKKQVDAIAEEEKAIRKMVEKISVEEDFEKVQQEQGEELA